MQVSSQTVDIASVTSNCETVVLLPLDQGIGVERALISTSNIIVPANLIYLVNNIHMVDPVLHKGTCANASGGQ